MHRAWGRSRDKRNSLFSPRLKSQKRLCVYVGHVSSALLEHWLPLQKTLAFSACNCQRIKRLSAFNFKKSCHLVGLFLFCLPLFLCDRSRDTLPGVRGVARGKCPGLLLCDRDRTSDCRDRGVPYVHASTAAAARPECQYSEHPVGGPQAGCASVPTSASHRRLCPCQVTRAPTQAPTRAPTPAPTVAPESLTHAQLAALVGSLPGQYDAPFRARSPPIFSLSPPSSLFGSAAPAVVPSRSALMTPRR